jgi:hypothetical protein
MINHKTRIWRFALDLTSDELAGILSRILTDSHGIRRRLEIPQLLWTLLGELSVWKLWNIWLTFRLIIIYKQRRNFTVAGIPPD